MKYYYNILILLCLLIANKGYSQIQQEMFFDQISIDSTKNHNLSLAIDNATFFKNNEYGNEISKGYTIFGYWLMPRLVYHPSENTKIAFGWKMLQYFGADYYPSSSPALIPDTLIDNKSQIFRHAPFFRIQYDPFENLHIVMGDIYGKANHQLIEPLYQWERYYTDDEPLGLQLIYDDRIIHGDVWIQWNNFIFKNENDLEQFIVGVVGEAQLLPNNDKWHLSIPAQLLIEHNGGQIDATDFGALSFLNFAGGAKLSENIGARFFQKWELSIYGLSSGEMGTRKLENINSGKGLYTKLNLDLGCFASEISYTHAKDFVTFVGEPILQSLSYMDGTTVFKHRDIIGFKAGYQHQIFNGMDIGVLFDSYYDPGKGNFDYSYDFHISFNEEFFLTKLKIVKKKDQKASMLNLLDNLTK